MNMYPERVDKWIDISNKVPRNQGAACGSDREIGNDSSRTIGHRRPEVQCWRFRPGLMRLPGRRMCHDLQQEMSFKPAYVVVIAFGFDCTEMIKWRVSFQSVSCGGGGSAVPLDLWALERGVALVHLWLD